MIGDGFICVDAIRFRPIGYGSFVNIRPTGNRSVGNIKPIRTRSSADIRSISNRCHNRGLMRLVALDDTVSVCASEAKAVDARFQSVSKPCQDDR